MPMKSVPDFIDVYKGAFTRPTIGLSKHSERNILNAAEKYKITLKIDHVKLWFKTGRNEMFEILKL